MLTLDDKDGTWFKKLKMETLEAVRLWEWFRSESLKRIQPRVTCDGAQRGSAGMVGDCGVMLEDANLLKSEWSYIVDLEKYDLPH